MTGNRRNKKGSVAVHNRNGMLRLRWTYLGQAYSFAMGLSDTPVNRAAAEAKAAEIQKDLAFHEFDPTLEKYRPKPLLKSLDTADLFQQFINYKVESGAIAPQTVSSIYSPLKRLIGKRTIRNKGDADKLLEKLSKRRSPRSYNQALTLYKSFGNWAVENGYMAVNPFSKIKSAKVIREPNKRYPFSPEEIKKLLSVMANDKKLAHYHDFCFTLFSLGLRPSEAIGLRWGAVNLETKQVIISEALIRSPEPGGRTRKGTKNSVIRVLQLSESLAEILRARRPADPNSDELIFKTRHGRPINCRNFSQKYWKPALELAGIPYRPPYTARHTLISYGIESGWSLPQAALVAGDSVGTIVGSYAHAIEHPTMPEWS